MLHIIISEFKMRQKRRGAEEKFICCQFQKPSNALNFLMEVDR